MTMAPLAALARDPRPGLAGHRTLTRRLFAALLGVHALIHLIGFAVPWRLLTTPDFPYATTVAWGSVDLGSSGIRVLGVAWLVVAAGFGVAAIGVWSNRSWAIRLTAAAVVASVPMTILGAPAAILGLLVDGAILAALAVRRWAN